MASMPGGGPARAAVAARRHQRLDLHQQRPRTLERGAGDAAGSVLVGGGQEGPAGVGDFGQAALGHLEDADFLGRAEPVLRGPEQPQRGRPLALEVQHGVDQMLERLGPGQGAVLGHVADEDDRDAVLLGQLHQPQRALANLADAAGRAFELVDGHGLDRVDDQGDGPRLAGQLDDAADLASRPRRRSGRRPSLRADPAGRPAAAPARPTPRPWHTGRRRRGRPRRRRHRAPPAHRQTGGRLQAAEWICRCPARRRAAPPSPGTSPPPRTRSIFADAGRDPDRLGLAQAAQRSGARRASGARPARRSAPLRPARGRRSRPGCSRRRTSGTGLPSGDGQRRTTGRCSGFAGGPPLDPAQRAASTGCFSSTGWMSRPASEPLSTMMRRAGRELAEQQLLGQHVLDHVLDHAAERPGAVGDVVADLDDVVLGRLRDLQDHALGLEPVADASQHQVHDQADLLDRERAEDDRGVDAVEELGPEGLLELLVDLLAASARARPWRALRPSRPAGGSPSEELVWSCLAPRLEVMMMMQLRKSTRRPLASERWPSSRICSSMLKTSGWAFSISSSRTTA